MRQTNLHKTHDMNGKAAIEVSIEKTYFEGNMSKMETKIGTRVGAILEVTDRHVKFLGYGTYLGDFIPEEAVGFLAAFFKETQQTCPKIELDSGQIVYGCECWWEEANRVKKFLSDYNTVETVNIDKIRAGLVKKLLT